MMMMSLISQSCHRSRKLWLMHVLVLPDCFQLNCLFICYAAITHRALPLQHVLYHLYHLYSCIYSLNILIMSVIKQARLLHFLSETTTESVALLVARWTNNWKVVGSRPTKVVCITVLTCNRMGVNCPLWPAATPSSEL